MPALADRTQPRPAQPVLDADALSAAPIDRAALVEGIGDHIAALAAGGPIGGAMAVYLEQAHGLYEFVAGVANQRGRSFADDMKIAKRNQLLKELGRTRTPKQLAAELVDYEGTCWPRDRLDLSKNPYPVHGRKHLVYQVFRLKPRSISARQLRNIL